MRPHWAQRGKRPAPSATAPSAKALPSKPRWARAAQRPQTGARARRPPARSWTPATLASLLDHELLPAWWVAFVASAAREAWEQPELWGVELFAGKAELSQAFRRMVGPFASYDILMDSGHDLLSQVGLLAAITMMLQVCSHGLLWLGTPCQSWIGLSRSYTRRLRIQPEGPHH